jgi:hypothetical protein
LGGYGALGPVTAQRQLPGQFMSYLCFTETFISAAIEAGIADATDWPSPPVEFPGGCDDDAAMPGFLTWSSVREGPSSGLRRHVVTDDDCSSPVSG